MDKTRLVIMVGKTVVLADCIGSGVADTLGNGGDVEVSQYAVWNVGSYIYHGQGMLWGTCTIVQAPHFGDSSMLTCLVILYSIRTICAIDANRKCPKSVQSHSICSRLPQYT